MKRFNNACVTRPEAASVSVCCHCGVIALLGLISVCSRYFKAIIMHVYFTQIGFIEYECESLNRTSKYVPWRQGLAFVVQATIVNTQHIYMNTTDFIVNKL